MKKLLIAEDDKFYINTLNLKLSNLGFEVMVVPDGAKALEVMKETKPDLVLLDLVMPVMDGFDVLKEVKSDSGLKNIKIVVLSNLGQDEDRKKAIDLGAIDYLVKTNLSIQEMVNKVKGYMK